MEIIGNRFEITFDRWEIRKIETSKTEEINVFRFNPPSLVYSVHADPLFSPTNTRVFFLILNKKLISILVKNEQ